MNFVAGMIAIGLSEPCSSHAPRPAGFFIGIALPRSVIFTGQSQRQFTPPHECLVYLLAGARGALSEFHSQDISHVVAGFDGPADCVPRYRTKSCQQRLRQLRSLSDYYAVGGIAAWLEVGRAHEGAEFAITSHFVRDRPRSLRTRVTLSGAGSARTKAGRETSRNWMKSPATFEETLARQAAVASFGRGRSCARPSQPLERRRFGAPAGDVARLDRGGSAPFPLLGRTGGRLPIAVCAVVLAVLYGFTPVLAWFLFGACILLPIAVLFACLFTNGSALWTH